MITLLTNQAEAARAFRKWADVMIGASSLKDYGWVLEGRGLAFSNYGDGDDGEIRSQVMLGIDPEFSTGIVKIVQPATSQGAKGKLTLAGRDENGRLVLLREGRLTKNSISGLVKDDDFAAFTGLKEEPVTAAGSKSNRHWYVLADLDASAEEIVSRTVTFVNACARARARAGGGTAAKPSKPFGYGMDETGGMTTVNRAGGTAEVLRLQGHVYEQLKKAVGPDLTKPQRNGFCVDGMIEPAKLLIEIKTGVFAHNLYEAVGQLHLYPALIGLPSGLTRMLLVPDTPMLKPAMAVALDGAGIEVFTYGIGKGRKKPKITFPAQLIERCKQRL